MGQQGDDDALRRQRRRHPDRRQQRPRRPRRHDYLDGGAGNDAIAGDNAEICFRPDASTCACAR
jgi:hypothetical protein